MLAIESCAQTPGSAPAVPEALRAAVTTSEVATGPGGEVLRQIDDPSTGDLWLLLRDQSRHGGPGRLVLARQRSNAEGAAIDGLARPLPAGERRVIRTGDALTVEEHTAVVDVRLEAVALESAAKGGRFRARLKIGGKVVRVVALSAGRAAFAPASEVEP